jgi:hypothetical protein
MTTVLGLIGLFFFVVAVVGLAMGVTWLVVKLFPSGKKKTEVPEAPAA